jgi:hypothetical protein
MPLPPNVDRSGALHRTGGGALIALILGDLLDLATSRSLLLTDPSPSFLVEARQWLDIWTSPVALGTAVAALVLWFTPRRRTFMRFFDATLALSVLALSVNAVSLVASLFDKENNPSYLLLSSMLVYVQNVAVFTAWYWRFDHRFRCEDFSEDGAHPALVFPHDSVRFSTLENWTPGIVDYVFLSFNTASTFGPTLPVPLRVSVQLGMMLQVTIAISVLGMLSARAIGLIT